MLGALTHSSSCVTLTSGFRPRQFLFFVSAGTVGPREILGVVLKSCGIVKKLCLCVICACVFLTYLRVCQNARVQTHTPININESWGALSAVSLTSAGTVGPRDMLGAESKF